MTRAMPVRRFGSAVRHVGLLALLAWIVPDDASRSGEPPAARWTARQTVGAAANPADNALLERLDRGLIAQPAPGGKVHLSWRLLASDPRDVAFDLYRRRCDSASGDSAASDPAPARPNSRAIGRISVGAGGGGASFGLSGVLGGAAEDADEDARRETETDRAAPLKLNKTPITATTDFVDSDAEVGVEYVWTLHVVGGAKSGPAVASVRAVPSADPKPYRAIRLDGDHTFQKVAVADLDGDGAYDFVIKQPNENVDPYAAPGYWKRSTGTYKLEAYRADGKFLWRHDLGWSIEQGIWYSPYVVYDLDGDGKAEVAVKTGEGDPRDDDGRVQTGPEYLTILDGQTGKPRVRTAWLSREGFGEGLSGYNYASRNQLAVAYLDGRHPSLIVLRGTYNRMKAAAYQLEGDRLVEQWRWDNQGMPREWQGQGAHWTHAADLDGDGRDELVLGSCVLDDDGKPLWTTGLGHPDHAYVGDLDPSRPGLEIYYGIETRRPRDGMCMVDAATGKILWGIDEPTRHVHSYGMASDIDARYPGCECYSADTDANKKFALGLLHSAKGELIARENLGGFGPRVVWWDADPQRELILGRNVCKYGRTETTLARFEGQYVATVDLWGDWREEIIVSTPGELRVYTTTIPANDRCVCLMQDRLYRMDTVAGAMGYYQVPMPSRNLDAEAK